jgi:hypothetical protein
VFKHQTKELAVLLLLAILWAKEEPKDLLDMRNIINSRFPAWWLLKAAELLGLEDPKDVWRGRDPLTCLSNAQGALFQHFTRFGLKIYKSKKRREPRETGKERVIHLTSFRNGSKLKAPEIHDKEAIEDLLSDFIEFLKSIH